MAFLDGDGVSTLVQKLKSVFVLPVELENLRNQMVNKIPDASTTAPLMDGTASYGSGTIYARSNHRHPTDTSRQAALVSGTNIKTVNSQSLLGSGNLAIQELPTVSASDNGKVLQVVNGAWASASLPIYDGTVE